jgi:predicted metal-dependent peptidase
MKTDRGHSDEVDRLSAVRMQLMEFHPFWGYLLLQTDIEWDVSLPSLAATDGAGRLWLSPDRTRHLSIRQLGFVLLHGVGHQILSATERQHGRDARLWDRAMDYAINRMVLQVCHPIWDEPLYDPPEGVLLSANFEGMIAEAIYEVLAEEQDVDEEQDGDEEQDVDEDQAESAPVEALQVAGQVVHDHGGNLDLHLMADIGGGRREEMVDRLRLALRARKDAGGHGELPTEVLDRILGLNQSRVPWQRVFRRFANEALARDELDPRRPNRRWLDEGFFVPGWGGETIDLVIVALDTSGSMSEHELEQAASEIQALSSETSDLRLVVADHEVQEVVHLDDLDRWLARGKAKGGGGTDHRPVFDWIHGSRLLPALFVGLSDLFSYFPKSPPPFPVIWVCPEEHGEPPFGTVITIR